MAAVARSEFASAFMPHNPLVLSLSGFNSTLGDVGRGFLLRVNSANQEIMRCFCATHHHKIQRGALPDRQRMRDILQRSRAADSQCESTRIDYSSGRKA